MPSARRHCAEHDCPHGPARRHRADVAVTIPTRHPFRVGIFSDVVVCKISDGQHLVANSLRVLGFDVPGDEHSILVVARAAAAGLGVSLLVLDQLLWGRDG